MRTAANLRADHEAPRAARDLLRGMAAQAGCDEGRVEHAVLLVSELVTNAVLHGRTDVVRLVLAVDGRTVEVAVHDRSPDAPLVGDVGPSDLHGRGLVLVERLAETWGVSPLPEGGGGKAVWFRRPCHEGEGSRNRYRPATCRPRP